jgi:NAD(P)-dependent dehydrogenase (short-subunit alcohol dehydrogenase family)
MPDPLFSVQDQVVLVSGASRGIGRAIAAGFVERGAQVIITGRHAESLEQTAADLSGPDRQVTSIVCDVARPDDVRRAADRALSLHGRIDTLINVAGVNRRKPALEVTDEDYDFVLDINLKGAFCLSRELGRAMVTRGSGCQINVASLNTDRPLKNVAPYAMSKAALGHMTRSLALEWGPAGVRVNAIAPGFILTDLTYKLWSDDTIRQWGLTNTPRRSSWRRRRRSF